MLKRPRIIYILSSSNVQSNGWKLVTRCPPKYGLFRLIFSSCSDHCLKLCKISYKSLLPITWLSCMLTHSLDARCTAWHVTVPGAYCNQIKEKANVFFSKSDQVMYEMSVSYLWSNSTCLLSAASLRKFRPHCVHSYPLTLLMISDGLW